MTDNENQIEHIGNVNNEIESQEPVGLQYFRAVDMLVYGETPDQGQYFNIQVYDKDGGMPKVIILRIQSNYPEGVVKKQDEIKIPEKNRLHQFNAESDEAGKYTSYPADISEAGLEYLNETVKILSEAVAIDGSKIYINNSVRMMSKGGIWWEVERGSRSDTPRLVEPKKQLPS